MRKSLFPLIFLLLSTTAISQQRQDIIKLWNNDVPGSVNPKRPMVIDTQRETSTIVVTEVTDPTLEVFKPKGKDNGMCVIVCPGGSYGILAYDKEGTDVAKWFSEQGYTAMTLAYRVPQQRDGALQDIQRAIRLAREKYNPSKIGVIGFSAGASLSARASTRFTESTYPRQDAADDLNCRPDFAMLIYPAYLDDGENRTLTPELTLSPQTPPMFIFATADDYYGNSALVMAQALRDNKTPVELHFINSGGHGYGMRFGAGLIWPKLLQNSTQIPAQR